MNLRSRVSYTAKPNSLSTQKEKGKKKEKTTTQTTVVSPRGVFLIFILVAGSVLPKEKQNKNFPEQPVQKFLFAYRCNGFIERRGSGARSLLITLSAPFMHRRAAQSLIDRSKLPCKLPPCKELAELDVRNLPLEIKKKASYYVHFFPVESLGEGVT